MAMDVMRTKSIEQSLADTQEPEYALKKNVTALDLTVFGIGAIIGAGIFVMTGQVAHDKAGPGVIFSFLIAAICCALAAMCYAEFASTVPVSGSAYTFSYASLGEIFAWIIGWDLILEFWMVSATVAQGWSGYFNRFLNLVSGQPSGGSLMPKALLAPDSGGVFDLWAFVLVVVLGLLIYRGIKESLRVNLVLVAIKLFIVLFVIVFGIVLIASAVQGTSGDNTWTASVANWTQYGFVPSACDITSAPDATTGLITQACATGTPQAFTVTFTNPGVGQVMTTPLLQLITGGGAMTAYGFGGVVAGASIVFFSFIGFDAVATTAEECRNPKRDLPIGIIGSLAISTVLYILVCLVVTAMVPFNMMDASGALAAAFSAVGQGWAGILISVGAIAGLATVVLTMMTGGVRIVYAMCRDNLLPLGFAKVHKSFRTPQYITIAITVVAALLASLMPFGTLTEMTNIGTLSAFGLVSVAVLVLRYKRPDLKRAFRVPGVHVVSILAALICLYLMLNLATETWIRFVVWLVVGFVIYFAYGNRHARVRTGLTLHDPSAPHHEPSDSDPVPEDSK